MLEDFSSSQQEHWKRALDEMVGGEVGRQSRTEIMGKGGGGKQTFKES